MTLGKRIEEKRLAKNSNYQLLQESAKWREGLDKQEKIPAHIGEMAANMREVYRLSQPSAEENAFTEGSSYAV